MAAVSWGDNINTKALGILAGRERVSNNTAGVYGESDHAGVYGHVTGDAGTGVFGHSAGANGRGVVGINSSSGIGVLGQSSTGQAGYFLGDVTVTGNITAHDILLPGSDCAEYFDAATGEQLDPGTVVVIGAAGALRESRVAYDKKVVGVVSGAGEYRHGILLGLRLSPNHRVAVALLGKTYCKVDAQYAPIEVGDSLTTSPTPGHAMKVADPSRAFGSVIGKALGHLDADRGLIPILIASQ